MLLLIALYVLLLFISSKIYIFFYKKKLFNDIKKELLEKHLGKDYKQIIKEQREKI
jgi:hypothetical protein